MLPCLHTFDCECLMKLAKSNSDLVHLTHCDFVDDECDKKQTTTMENNNKKGLMSCPLCREVYFGDGTIDSISRLPRNLLIINTLANQLPVVCDSIKPQQSNETSSVVSHLKIDEIPNCCGMNCSPFYLCCFFLYILCFLLFN